MKAIKILCALLLICLNSIGMENKNRDNALLKNRLFYESKRFDVGVLDHMCTIDHILFYYTNIYPNTSRLNLLTGEIRSLHRSYEKRSNRCLGLKTNNDFIFCRYPSNTPSDNFFQKQIIRIMDPETSGTYRKYCDDTLDDFACNQQTLATLHNHEEVHLFDIRHQEVAQHFTSYHNAHTIELSPDTQTVIMAEHKLSNGPYNKDKEYICLWDRRNTTKPRCKYAAPARINTLLASNDRVFAGLNNGALICYSLKNYFFQTIDQVCTRPKDLYYAQNTFISLKKCADNSMACLTKSKVTLYNEDYSKKATILLPSHYQCTEHWQFDYTQESYCANVMDTYENKIIVAGKSSISMYEETE